MTKQQQKKSDKRLKLWLTLPGSALLKSTDIG